MIQQKNKHRFGITIGQLEQYRVGEHKGVAAKLSKMARAVNRNSAVLGPPSQVDRLIIPQVRMFKLDLSGQFDDGWDYVTGHTWDGTTTGKEDVLILKPWFLRGTYWDELGDPGKDPARNDITYTQDGDQDRTAHKDGEDDESQKIIPSYITGDVIFAIRGIYGGFDVSGVHDEPGVGMHPEESKWMDLNVDGRMWAKV